MGFSEILLIMAIALILFGPEDLPDIARMIGKVVYEIRKVTQELTSEFQSSLIDNPVHAENKQENQNSVKETSRDEPEKDDLLTYEDEIKADPLANLPADMVSYEEKGASR